MRTFDLDLGKDRSLHGTSAGAGPDLLLLHGALTTSHDWLSGPFDNLVKEGFRVTAVDRPGHGRSRRPRFEGTPRDQAAHIHSGFPQIGLDRPLILAHSFGALVALALAEQFPKAVAGLVLVAPLAFPEPRPLEHLLMAPRSIPLLGPILSIAGRATIDRPLLEGLQRLMFSPQPIPPRWKETFPYDQVLDSGSMVFEGEDAAAFLPFSPAGSMRLDRIAVPVHILTGTSDRIVDPSRHARPLAKVLRTARITEVEGAGHMVHHARPDLLIEAARQARAARLENC